MFQKYFTPKEANTLLKEVKPLVYGILEKGKILKTRLEENSSFADTPQAMHIQEEIVALMRKLEGLGCFFKDWNFEIGLVDFPAMIDDEEALLCWRSDEAEVLWYHSIDDGFAGRRPLPEYWLLDMKDLNL